MANITRKSNGNCLVRVYCGEDAFGKKVSKSAQFKPSKKGLSEARYNQELYQFVADFEEKVKEQWESGEMFDSKKPERILFKNFCPKYLEIKKEVLSPETYAFYKKIIEQHLIPMYGKMYLDTFRIYHVQQYIQFVANKDRKDRYAGQKKIAASTVKRYVTVFRSILSLAYKMEFIDTDISMSRRLEFPKSTPPEVEVYNEEEVRSILEATKEEPISIRTMIEVALFTGCRRGEIVGLKWGDINLDRQQLSVKRSIYKPKDGKAQEKAPKSIHGIRNMTIPQSLCDTLREYKKWQDKYKYDHPDVWEEHDYIFTEFDGNVMNPQTPTKQFDHFLKRHNIRHLKFHGLRHTSATLLLANGCDIKTVSARLGHADIDTTNIYVHVLDATDKNAANTFDHFVKGDLQ